ncbi:MAG: hypothetical protein Q9160_007455 [Pyrenula sp. 1 TL-2023]
MDLTPTAAAKLLLPKAPLILKTALLNALSLSPSSKKQNLRTEVTVAVVRAFMSTTAPIGRTQKTLNRDLEVKGPVWISKLALPSPEENDVRDAVVRCIRELGDGQETFDLPDVQPVEGEWTGCRSAATPKEPRPPGSEAEMYTKMMEEVNSDVTTLFFHGGGHILLDPAGYRAITAHIAKLTGGKLFSVRYRLAPQNPFPSALLDAFIAYLSLLSPPPGSPHPAISPSCIILAGDSAGGNLALSLLLLLLTLRRIGVPSIRFHGTDVSLHLPAGLTVSSPWCDPGRTQPSTWSNAHLDYLPVPDRATGLLPDIPADEFWPATPVPRSEMYCDATVIAHPLVTPLAAKPGLWEGAPPVFMCLGSEILQDEALVTARRIHDAGATVQLEHYDGMPHDFILVCPKHPNTKACWGRWTEFVKRAVEGTVERKDDALWVEAFTLKEERRRWEDVTSITDEEVDGKLNEGREKRVEVERELRKRAEGVGKAKL